jgi:hypothetical protein
MARLSRAVCAPAKSSSMGAAVPVIMPTIITAHIVNVKNTSIAVHGLSIDMPMFAIIESYAMDDDI